MADNIERRGGCLCGAVRVLVTTSNNDVAACHCGMCRKWTGGPLLAVGCGGDVHFDGADSISVYRSSDWAERGFCSRCGSHLYYRLTEGDRYELPVGLLDDTGDWVFKYQIFTGDKPSYYAFANDTENLTGAEVFAQHGAPPE